MADTISAAAAAAGVQAVVDLIDAAVTAGTVEFRTGAKPVSVATAASGTLLANVTLPSPLWASYTAGVATANTSGAPAVVAQANAAAEDDIGWFRAKDGDGVAVMDGTVGLSGASMLVNRVDTTTGQPVIIESWTVTLPTV